MKLKVYTDGGARGNPGPAGIGAVIKDLKKVLWSAGKYIGETTNNQAEYKALIFGLEKAKELKAVEVECFLDSELVAKQMNREYKVKDKDLAPLFVKVWNLTMGFKKVTFKHIYREDNKDADFLVNEAIDKALKKI
ncbi:MAG: ribonuclease HI family protein [Patescibacteria group bacterium]|nr:ribonuclease HI family protein [Patescibacteria group bacterium]MDD5490605.1 ribonuclease HI family protein [Patescibacteria group bacterium]